MSVDHRPTRPFARQSVVKVADGEVSSAVDGVVVEEPMEIRVGTLGASEDDLVSLAVTMRTPGHDFELATGFVVSEGIAAQAADVRQVAYCGLPTEQQEYNIVTVRLDGDVDVARHRRNVFTTSSCGICGKASIDALEVACPVLPVAGVVAADVVSELPDGLRASQKVFDVTGGVHAAGLADQDGNILVVREDVGRHNAVDKLIGWAVQRSLLPLSNRILVVSGRSSFEIVQKAAVAGIAVVVAVSAPSSLAVRVAERFGMTLIGFTRDRRFNIYTGEHRIEIAALSR